MNELVVIVRRFDPERGSCEQEYRVPVNNGEVLSVLNVLEYIYQNLDATLAFFSHAACKQAACGKCMVKINGKNGLACKERAEGPTLSLAPYGKDVVRDLVCR